MTTMIAQLSGIVRYESKIQQRTFRWMLVGVSFMVISLLIVIIYSPQQAALRINIVDTTFFDVEFDENSGTLITIERAQLKVFEVLGDRVITESDLQRFWNTIPVLDALRIGLLMLLALLTVMMSDVIPLDRKDKMRETLFSTPLNALTYLIGKVLTVWVNLWRICAIGAVILALVVWIFRGPFDWTLYLVIWGMVIVPSAMLVCALSVLLPSFAHNRRVAIGFSVILLPLVILLYAVIIFGLMDVIVLIDPAYRFTNGFLTFPELPEAVILGNIARLYGQGLLIGLLALLIAWFFQIREQRR
ncbi:MAG: hypothetical protein MUF87_03040 [Anaerolineae bacterium]|jgi:ABC-type transport system involved in multi-copper enzyme maturation permease subunit|nr:hypothetical protein [Anaerolineae bacterium]